MKDKFNLEMKKIRDSILEDIYDNKEVSEAELSISDLFIYSKNKTFFSRLNRVQNISILDEEITLTDEQVECLDILEDSNLFLSAPTSFGKTYIALEHVARHASSLNNIVIVVPTISLMNELRKKCYKFFGDEFITITSDSELQEYYNESKKIIIVVPERISTKKFRDYLNRNDIDLLIYDEIYKLKYEHNPNKTNDRIIKMNHIYKYLLGKSKKTVLLGPYIKDVSFEKSNLSIEKYITNLNLVYSEIEYMSKETSMVFQSNDEKQFVYFKSPGSINRFLDEETTTFGTDDWVDFDSEIIEWISENVHPEWYYAKYLKMGIGIHHGKTPIFLRKYIEQEYSSKNGKIDTILCTSTLMEGINTPTNRLIIYDAPNGTFELNNLIGRVGRLNTQKPKPGQVVILDESVKGIYDPDQWIELSILFEIPEIVTTSPQDEIIYLEKECEEKDITEPLREIEQKLKTDFDIEISEIEEAGIEFIILKRFLENYNTITNYARERNVINDIKNILLKEHRQYLRGLLYSQYSFNGERGRDESETEYIGIDVVYQLIMYNGKMKPVIKRFIELYEANAKDINLFIDTLFQVDEYIKFKLMKVIAIFDLFNSKGIFDKHQNRAFIQSMHLIASYYDSEDGYNRILSDMGIPKEDIDDIANSISDYTSIKGTERKLKQLEGQEVFNTISPFSRKIIQNL